MTYRDRRGEHYAISTRHSTTQREPWFETGIRAVALIDDNNRWSPQPSRAPLGQGRSCRSQDTRGLPYCVVLARPV